MVRSGYEKRTDPPVLLLKAEASFLNTERDDFVFTKILEIQLQKNIKKEKGCPDQPSLQVLPAFQYPVSDPVSVSLSQSKRIVPNYQKILKMAVPN